MAGEDLDLAEPPGMASAAIPLFLRAQGNLFETIICPRLLKNAQMQGARNPEE
jgi:hypothetical protein